jgi:hypothetical protein
MTTTSTSFTFTERSSDYSGNLVYDCTIEPEIKWKDERDLTKEFEVKQQNKSECLFCTLDSEVRYARYKSQATSTNDSPNRIIFSLAVAPIERAIEAGRS